MVVVASHRQAHIWAATALHWEQAPTHLGGSRGSAHQLRHDLQYSATPAQLHVLTSRPDTRVDMQAPF